MNDRADRQRIHIVAERQIQCYARPHGYEFQPNHLELLLFDEKPPS